MALEETKMERGEDSDYLIGNQAFLTVAQGYLGYLLKVDE